MRSKKTAERAPVARLRQEARRALLAAGVGAGERVVVGCSHGPDSLALADAIVALAGPLGLAGVTLVYVNHGLRPEAAEEGERVRAFAAAAGVDAEVVGVEVTRAGRGLEDAARGARHRALAAVARARGARWIALGHTADDQAETLLMRLLRGAGPAGLAGIPRTRGLVVRPLLALSRADVLAYLAARGLEPSLDLSNADESYLRNRVRARLLPALAAENPRAAQALARAAASQRELADALAWMVSLARRAARVEETPGRRRVPAGPIARLPAAVGKRLLIDLAAELGVALAAPHVDALWRLLGRGGELSLPGGRAEVDGGVLSLACDTAPTGIGIRALVTVSGEGGPYRVRTFRAGDRMRPAARGGRSRKLADLFQAARVPRGARAHAVVVEDARGEIAWAEHVGRAHGATLRVSLTHLLPRVTPH
jgi:tRNA(Ile)-lysidine synthase